MKRGLVIGNSHAAMVMEAQTARREESVASFDLAYFTEPGDGPAGVKFARGRMRAIDPRLVDFLDRSGSPRRHILDDYDFALIVGCGASLYQAMPMLRNSVVQGWPSAVARRGKLGLKNGKPGVHLISAACYRDGLLARMRATISAGLYAGLRSTWDGSVFVAPQPRPCARLRDMTERPSMFRRAEKAGDGPEITRVFDETLQVLFEGARILRQPAETLDGELFTARRYTEDARRLIDLNTGFDEDDVLHANRLYGEKLLVAVDMALSDPQTP